MRAIDADALTDEIRKYANDPVKLRDRRWDARCKAIIADMIGTVKTMPTIGGWISVKDRLPNSNGCYIVWRPHFYPDFGMPSICYFDGSNTWHDSYGVDFERTLSEGDVTHWMPLPQKPKEEY